MIKSYGSSAFSKLTGIDRTTLFRWNRDGLVVALKTKDGKLRYTNEFFLNPEIIKKMKARNIAIPKLAMDELLGKADTSEATVTPTKLKAVPVEAPPKKAKVLPFTSEKKLATIEPGFIKDYIKPLSGMPQLARDIWDFTIRDLIELGTLRKSDLHILKNYCMTQSHIVEMENLLIAEGYISEMDGKLNPLVTAIDKYKSTARTMANSINITSQGRKDIKIPEKDDDGEWGDMLKG